ncbi:hypothetical protein BGX28_000587 [Mortierella sp. GBA30]|nr:hypothetical protein BGX28_000587 [Mortierella sp. GBA30]
MTPIHRLTQLTSHLVRAPIVASPIWTGAIRASSHLSRNYTSSTTSDTSASYKVTKKDRAFYPYALDIQSRWADNDQYGHLNNAHYYSLFDTVINTFLIQEAGLHPNNDSQGNAIGVVAESGCQYFSSLTFPDMIEARLAVIKLGRSSVVYQVGIFKKLTPSETRAYGGSGPEIKTTLGSSPTSAGVFSRAASSVMEKGGEEGEWVPVAEDKTHRVFHPSLIQGDAAASGHFCHVFVDKTSRRPVPIPEKIRAGLELLQVRP